MKWWQGTIVFSSVLAIVVANLSEDFGCPNKTQAYLTEFGYLNPMKNCTVEDLKAALRKFQEMNVNFQGLNITGECDPTTIKVMNMPRCGCEDIDKFEKPKMMPSNVFAPHSYRVGMGKWPKKELTWKVLKYPIRNSQLSNAQVDDAMKRGLQIWADVSSLSFRESTSNPDVKIRFETGRHTTSPPYYDFDGRGNVLAHAFFPTSGEVHFDDDENYVLNTNQGTELYIVAAHEFGHTLGISHSNIQEALMAPYYRYENPLTLHPDDIAAVQSLYGKPDTVVTTKATPRPTNPTNPTNPPTVPTPTPPLPTLPPNFPDHCDIKVQASFKVAQDDTTFVFASEKVSSWRIKTFVYKITSNGLDASSKKPIEEMFRSRNRFQRGYPFRVDAAAYVPDRKYIFLFSNTRAYRYSVSGSVTEPFYLDSGYPRWMDVREFPERPLAAVAMPYTNYNAYYMLIFGRTMVWDWNFFTQRVGAWAYPINVYGRNMPMSVGSAYLQDSQNVVFVKNTKYYLFNLRYRRVLSSASIKDVKKDLFKGQCAQ